LNLQTDQYILYRVLTDELTNRSVRGLETGENELTNISVQIQRWIIDADTDTNELTTD
jgi:hypothetical protein